MCYISLQNFPKGLRDGVFFPETGSSFYKALSMVNLDKWLGLAVATLLLEDMPYESHRVGQIHQEEMGMLSPGVEMAKRTHPMPLSHPSLFSFTVRMTEILF